MKKPKPLDLISVCIAFHACHRGVAWLQRRRDYDTRRGHVATFAERWRQALDDVPDYAWWLALLGIGDAEYALWCCDRGWGRDGPVPDGWWREWTRSISPARVERAVYDLAIARGLS